MRILYFGMLGTLSSLPLLALLEAGCEVVGLVMSVERVPPYLVTNGRLPIQLINTSSSPNLLSQHVMTLEIASQHQLPVYAVQSFKSPETHYILKALAPDIICVSCFSHRLPPQILQIPTAGCLNVHPSLLPQFRGAAPIFWAFRQGVQETGVSIHWMDEGFDTGDVVAQRPFRLSNGISAPETEWALAHMGGQLLVEVLEQLAANQVSATRQPTGGYAAPWPAASDFELDLSWTAQRAYNFMWGTQGWKRPYFIVLNGQN
ncbi:MAG: methionyl-tRNA formyltransferase, partial [Chloroflexota bacterium]